MPLLDFKCMECGNKFNELVYGSNRNKLKCPNCGSSDLKQIYEGKCYFGMLGSTSGSGGCSGKSCDSCSGCSH
jgi:putative FmdB family regulatory protein